MSSQPENMYEVPKNSAEKEDIRRLQRQVLIGFIFLAVVALVAVGIAVYAVTKDSNSSSDKGNIINIVVLRGLNYEYGWPEVYAGLILAPLCMILWSKSPSSCHNFNDFCHSYLFWHEWLFLFCIFVKSYSLNLCITRWGNMKI